MIRMTEKEDIHSIKITEEDYYMGIPITVKSFVYPLFSKYAKIMNESLKKECGLDLGEEYIMECLYKSLEIKPRFK